MAPWSFQNGGFTDDCLIKLVFDFCFAVCTHLVVAPSRTRSPHMYWRICSQWLFWSPHECWLVHSTERIEPS